MNHLCDRSHHGSKNVHHKLRPATVWRQEACLDLVRLPAEMWQGRLPCPRLIELQCHEIPWSSPPCVARTMASAPERPRSRRCQPWVRSMTRICRWFVSPNGAPQKVVVSIFVNPTQFAPAEDFGSYPRTWTADVAKLAAENVELIRQPDVKNMYPKRFATKIVPEDFQQLCWAACTECLAGG
jgi:Pantoate-beta-alanine ligase